MEEAEKRAIELLEAGENAAKMLEFVKATLDQMPLPIEPGIVLALDPSPLMRRNHGLAAALLEGGNKLGCGIPAIGDDLLESEPIQEGVSLRAVMPLSSGQKHAQRIA